METYCPEERWNTLSHGLGFLLSLLGFALLLSKGIDLDNWIYLSSLAVFGITLIFLYFSSTVYHFVKTPKKKALFKTIDHIAIYFLIAGTYTPFTVITLGDTWGIGMLITIWTLALLGGVFKLFYTGRFNVFSTLLYLAMGWLSILIIKPMIVNLAWDGVLLLTWGGVIYTVGTVFYLADRMPYNHAVWHLFVIGGSVLHFLSVFYYVEPGLMS